MSTHILRSGFTGVSLNKLMLLDVTFSWMLQRRLALVAEFSTALDILDNVSVLEISMKVRQSLRETTPRSSLCKKRDIYIIMTHSPCILLVAVRAGGQQSHR